MYHQFYMVTGDIYVVQTEVNMIGRQVQREEADKGKLQGFGGDNGVVIILAPRGGDPRKYSDMYLLGGQHRSGGVYLCGVGSMYPDSGDVPGRGVPDKGAQPRSALRTFNVQTL